MFLFWSQGQRVMKSWAPLEILVAQWEKVEFPIGSLGGDCPLLCVGLFSGSEAAAATTPLRYVCMYVCTCTYCTVLRYAYQPALAALGSIGLGVDRLSREHKMKTGRSYRHPMWFQKAIQQLCTCQDRYISYNHVADGEMCWWSRTMIESGYVCWLPFSWW